MATNLSVPAHAIPQTGRNSLGRFVTGNTGGPGRRPGARNRLSRQFLADLEADWAQNGPKVIERVRRDDPAAYLRVVATLVRPVQDAEAERDEFRDLSREELLDIIIREFPRWCPDFQIVPRPKLVNQPKLAAISPP
jgi:hypothetical protein